MPNTATQFKVECEPENAQKFFNWIKTRQGIARWRSINLSNPGASWSTPATIRREDCEPVATAMAAEGEGDIIPYPKPNWQCANEPEVITDPKEVGVYIPELYKAFPVATRISGSGLMTKLTDASQRKLDKHLDACREKHGDSFYRRGVLDIDRPSMGIYFTKSIQPLDEWIARNGEGNPEVTKHLKDNLT